MKPIFPLLMTVAIALSACATTAPAPAPADPPPVAGVSHHDSMAAATAAAKDDDLICRSEAVLGSRFRQKTCKTRAQRELDAKRSREELERANTRGAPITSR